jgi:hypothetical protein
MLQMPKQIFQFVEEQPGRPEIRALVSQVRGAAIAELVIMNHRPAARGEPLEGIDIVMVQPGPPWSTTSGALRALRSPVTRYQVR